MIHLLLALVREISKREYSTSSEGNLKSVQIDRRYHWDLFVIFVTFSKFLFFFFFLNQGGCCDKFIHCNW